MSWLFMSTSLESYQLFLMMRKSDFQRLAFCLVSSQSMIWTALGLLLTSCWLMVLREHSWVSRSAREWCSLEFYCVRCTHLMARAQQLLLLRSRMLSQSTPTYFIIMFQIKCNYLSGFILHSSKFFIGKINRTGRNSIIILFFFSKNSYIVNNDQNKYNNLTLPMQGIDSESMFQCPYCGYQFDSDKRKPMILCMSQHTSCSSCVQLMFKGKNKEELIECPFKCSKIHYGSIQKFRYLDEIRETKHKLKKVGSDLFKQRISLTMNQQSLIESLQKEKAKNQWLIQINQKRQSSQSQESDKMVRQLKEQMNRERLIMQENFRKTLVELDKSNRLMFQKKLEQHKTQNSKMMKKMIQEESKKNQSKNEERFEQLQKIMIEQLAEIKKIEKSMLPLEKIEKNMIKSSEFEDLSRKTIKALETDSDKINIEAKEEKNVISRKQSKNKIIPQVKVENKISDKKMSSPNYLETIPSFKKSNSPTMVFEAKKEEPMNRDRSTTLKIQKTSDKLKTEPDEKIIQNRMGYYRNPNLMRATLGPDMFAKYLNLNESKDIGSQTLRQSNSFKQGNKNSYNYQSQKNLIGNVSLIEQQTAQQKKVSSIMDKIQRAFGKDKVSKKSIMIKLQIDKIIHLSENEIIEHIKKKIAF